MSTNQPIKRIKKLDALVIAQIKAGEVVHSPSSVIKELLENSLDAGAKSITVTSKDGGMKLLQIQDDGTGIQKDDLKDVCARHTTSKISSADDLKTVQTFGFRGEALASISHTAHVTILSYPANQNLAFKMSYTDGAPDKAYINAEKGPQPKASSGKKGTTITVEDLFYNNPTRRKTIKDYNAEYHKLVDVVRLYALNNSGTSFSCKKLGESLSDIQTQQGASTLENIKVLFGSTLVNVLLPLNLDDTELGFQMQGYISQADYNADKNRFILFVNKRLVSNKELKREISKIYASKTNAKVHSFVYLSLQINPLHLDVNVHPSKEEVYILNQKDVFKSILNYITEKLVELPSSNSNAPQPTVPKPVVSTREVNVPFKPVSSGKEELNIDELIHEPNQQQSNSTLSVNRTSHSQFVEAEPTRRKKRKVTTKLTSINTLIEEIEASNDDSLWVILANGYFVGVVDEEHSLIQYKDNLYLLNNYQLTKELFYQQILFNFSRFKSIAIDPPLPLWDLLEAALECEESQYSEELGDKGEIISSVRDQHEKYLAMYKEYFAIDITEMGLVSGLPLIIDGYAPALENLPRFLLNLAVKVEFSEEKSCLYGIAQQLADFYAVRSAAPEALDLPLEDEAMNTPSTPRSIKPRYPVKFIKEFDDDHPLFRAVQFCETHREAYLFAREYESDAKISHGRWYIANPVDDFIKDYLTLTPATRIYEDVIREGKSVKFYADLEFDVTLNEENNRKEMSTNQMSRTLKLFIQQLWEDLTKRTVPSSSWLEFDASKQSKKVSRHLHNDSIVFNTPEDLHLFMIKLRDRVQKKLEEDDEEAKRLAVYREKNGSIKEELFFDMLVYGKNKLLRLPWSTKFGEHRHFYPVLEGVVRRDIVKPQPEMFKRVLSSYFPDGRPTFAFGFPHSELSQLKSKSQSPLNRASGPIKPNARCAHRKLMEDVIMPSIRKDFVCPKRLREDGTILKITQSITPMSFCKE